MSGVMAGGGIRGGQTYGKTDSNAGYPTENPIDLEDVTKTVYRTMGIENLEAADLQGRPYNLLEQSRVLDPLLS